MAGVGVLFEHGLSDRAQVLLRILIESYIRDGQPVGSRVLSRDSGLQLSSATIAGVRCCQRPFSSFCLKVRTGQQKFALYIVK